MKTKAIFILVVVALISLHCEKASNVGPGDSRHLISNVGAYYILPHGVAAIPPNEVNLFFNVIDTAKNPVENLTASSFLIKENDIPINTTKAALSIRQRNTLDYHFDTILLLDVSAGVNIEALKNATQAFVSAIDPDQSIAIYIFSSTLNTIQSLTNNQTQLANAINSITTGTSERNLYGAISQGFMMFSESYSPGIIRQCQLVIFTAGMDTKGEKTKEEIVYTAQFTNVYCIGFGNTVDQDLIKKLGNRGAYLVTDENKLTETFLKVQTSIAGFANSYYRISYQSSLRGTATQQVQLSILTNAYDGPGSTMSEVFKADQFFNVATGIRVDWTPVKPQGVDTLIIGINVPRRVTALSQGGDNYPIYEWSSADERIMTVEPVAQGLAEAILRGKTVGNTSLIVADKANGFADTVFVQAVQSYDGFVLREWWNNLSGATLSDFVQNPRFPDFPSGRQYIKKMEGPQGIGDNYGTRLRAFVRPPVSGTYSFWIASDDQSQLFLSMNEDPSQKVPIAKVDTWTNSQAFDTYPSQHSVDFQLEAGKAYYIEAIHREGSGGDNISVAWQGPGLTRAVISGQYLSAWLGN
ncbi:MAG: VWA domain-containing protein [candidate division KSB1 bacterium]|nr:VWA domain-containing protein [candidate division KSB1 bacterium]